MDLGTIKRQMHAGMYQHVTQVLCHLLVSTGGFKVEYGRMASGTTDQ